MRNTKKANTLESKFPLLAVEQGCIISKDGDITVAYEVTLPEIFTVTSQEYESVHAARIINDSGYISLRRLTDDEITGTERTTGLVGKYLSLSTENVQCLEDMELSASGMRIGNKHLCLHTLSQTEDLPTEVSTDNRFERLSTDRSDCRLSFAAPVGLLLSCNHIYNQYMEELKHLRNDVGSQLASMECVPRHNTVDCPTLFWAAIPGNEGDFPSEEEQK